MSRTIPMRVLLDRRGRPRLRNQYPDIEAWLDDTRLTLSAAAERIGISTGYFCDLLHKKEEPSYRTALKLVQVCRVPFDSLLIRPLDDNGVR